MPELSKIDDRGDFSWLDECVQKLPPISDKYGFEWAASVNSPATETQLCAAEAALQMTLPPSLRRFYLRHDGASVASYAIASLDDLVSETLRLREETAAVYDEPTDAFLAVVSFDGSADRYVLDSAASDASGEYPLMDAFHEVGPSAWREAIVGESFGAWLRRLFEKILVEAVDPITGESFDRASFSPEYLIEAALQAEDAGDRDGARSHALRAVGWRGLSSQPTDILEKALPLLQACAENAGDRFLVHILRRSLAEKHAGRIVSDYIYLGDALTPVERFRSEFGIEIPPIFSGIMREYGSMTLFRDEKYRAPYESNGAALELFGGKWGGFRRFTDSGDRGDMLVVGVVGRSGAMSYGGGDSYDLVVLDHRGAVFFVPFRSERSKNVVSNGFFTMRIEQCSAPIPAASSIEVLIDNAFENRASGRPAYDLT